MLRYRIVFKGRVQGVGFRFTTERVARNLGITGWVRNLPSGGVETVAEAEEKKLKAFLAQIRAEFGDYIYDYTCNELAATGEFQGFRITF